MVPQPFLRQFALVLMLLLVAGCRDSTQPTSISRVEVSAPARFVDVGQTLQLSATALDDAGQPLTGVQFTWQSSNEAIASVVDGLVTAHGVGTVMITSSARGQEGQIEITVEPAVGSVAWEPGAMTLAVGKTIPIAQPTSDHAATATAPLLVVMRDASGQTIPQHSISFGTSNSAVARVTEAGQIQAVGAGSARIVATAGQVSGELSVDVVRPYTLVSLGTLGGTESRAYGINEQGQVVGEACSTQQCRIPFIWNSGTMTALEGPGVAHAIDETGTVVGTTQARAGMWQNGKLTVLYGNTPNVGPANGSAWAHSVNRNGEIVGAWIGGFCTRNCPWGGFRWRNGEIAEFPLFAHAINNNGQIAGFRYINMATPQAAILENGQIRDIAPPGSAAYDINDRGEAVGFSTQQSGSPAFRWHNGTATNLGVLRGRNLGRAYGINNQGQIVGASGGTGGDFSMSSPRAFLWQNDRLTDLNHLFVDDVWVFEDARAINDRGQIVGFGRNRNSGAVGALLLNPPQ